MARKLTYRSVFPALFLVPALLLAACDDAGDQQAAAPEEEKTGEEDAREESTEEAEAARAPFSGGGLALDELPPRPVAPPSSPPPPPPAAEAEVEEEPGRITVDVTRPDFGARTRVPDRPLASVTRQMQLRFDGGDLPATVFSVTSNRADLFRLGGCLGAVLSATNPVCLVEVVFDAPDLAPGAYQGEIVVVFETQGRTETRSVPATARIEGGVVTGAPPPPPPPPPPDAVGPTPRELLRLRRVRAPTVAVIASTLVEARADPLDRFDLTDDDYEAKWGQTPLESGFPVDQSRMISKFFTIPAVIETPINSALESKFIAVVSKNVYGRLGPNRYVLLPAGTRIIGFNGTLEEIGDSRLPAILTEIERPDGARVVIDAAAHDQMGRPGLIGTIDHRYWERFGTTALAAVANGMLAYVAAESSDPGFEAAQQEIADAIAEIGSAVLEDTVDLAPRMSIPGGARIQIMMREDIWFPEATRIVVGNPDELVDRSALPPGPIR